MSLENELDELLKVDKIDDMISILWELKNHLDSVLIVYTLKDGRTQMLIDKDTPRCCANLMLDEAKLTLLDGDIE
jgi:hypothetical protein